jgi:hypothetical protein
MNDKQTIARLEAENRHLRQSLVFIRRQAENALAAIPSHEPFAEAAKPGEHGSEPGEAVNVPLLPPTASPPGSPR